MYDEYIEKQLVEISKWEQQKPSVVNTGMNKIFSPMSKFTRKVIPEVVVEKAIYHAHDISQKLASKNDILKNAGVNTIEELRHKDLALSDKLASSVHKWAIGFAGSEGFATGLGGTATMVADVGAVIVLAFRTIHKIAMCYGYEVKSAEDKEFVLNILSVSGANDMKEKKEALLALKSDFLQKKIIEEVLMSNLVKKVAKQLGINLTKRKLMQIMPIIGAGIGAAVNASYINDIAWTARRSYQLKWLADNEYIDANNLNNI